MPIDLEAAKQALKYHCTDAACRSKAQCCEIGSGETVGALILEIERLRRRLWAYVSPRANMHSGSCALTCAEPSHYPEGDPEEVDDDPEFGGMSARQVQILSEGRWIPVAERLPEPKIWYVGLVVSTDIDFDTKERMRVVRLVRGYPREDEPKDLLDAAAGAAEMTSPHLKTVWLIEARDTYHGCSRSELLTPPNFKRYMDGVSKTSDVSVVATPIRLDAAIPIILISASRRSTLIGA